jgi:hypothetical protein
MFTIIHPSSWGRHARTLSRILETRKSFSDGEVDSFDMPSTIYVAYEKESLGVFGSCRLNLLRNSPAASFYEEKILSSKSYLEVSLISFKMANDHWLNKNPGALNRAKKVFYKSLYHTLVNLALSMGFKGIMSLNLEDESSDFLFLRKWPFKENYFFKSPQFRKPFFISEIPVIWQDRAWDSKVS